MFPASAQERKNIGGARNGVLKTEGSTDLWSEELLLYEIDLVISTSHAANTPTASR